MGRTMEVRLRSLAAGRRGATVACPQLVNMELNLHLYKGDQTHHGGEAAVFRRRQARRHRCLPTDAGALVLPGLGTLVPPCSSTQRSTVGSAGMVSCQPPGGRQVAMRGKWQNLGVTGIEISRCWHAASTML